MQFFFGKVCKCAFFFVTLRRVRQSGLPVMVGDNICYAADSHHGSLSAPLQLVTGDNRPYKVIENDRVIIIRDGERYDMTGLKIQ